MMTVKAMMMLMVMMTAVFRVHAYGMNHTLTHCRQGPAEAHFQYF